MPKRTDADYEIEGFSKGIRVLEALEGIAFQPVPIKTIVERTGLPENTVFRALKTAKMHGYAVYENKKWRVDKRLIRFAGAIAKSQV